MTLILTLLNRKHVVQVSDRRIVRSNPDGRTIVLDDNENKAIYVIGEDCNFGVSYTGLARIGATTTDDWLSRRISMANRGFQPYEKLQKELYGPILDEIRRQTLLPSNGRLNTTVVAAGFRAGPQGETVSFIEPISTAVREWHLKIVEKPLEYVVAHGMVSAISGEVIRKIKVLSDTRLFRTETGEKVASRLVGLIREAADDPKNGKFIGKDCMSIVVRPDPHILYCERYVQGSDVSPYPKPVIGSPIIVVSAWRVRFRTQDPRFSLKNLAFGPNATKNMPLKEGENSFMIHLPEDGSSPWREH